MSAINTIELALATTGSLVALAKLLGVTPSHVSRLRKGTVGLGPEASLRLSRLVGRPALRGLRDDGHNELADLLQSVLEFQDHKRTTSQRTLDEDLAALQPTDLRHIRALIASLADASRQNATRQR